MVEKYVDLLKSTDLFRGLTHDDVSVIVNCLLPSIAHYNKGQAIALQGDKVPQVGIIATGRAKMRKEDINGNIITLDELSAGDIFGDNFVSFKTLKIPVSIWTVTQTTIIFIDYDRIIMKCPSDCGFHRKLMQNMLDMMSSKLQTINDKVSILQNNTIRGKLMAFFEMQAEKAGSRQFSIPLNKSELAEYIGVNRSAMSRELCNMRNDGLVEFEGSTFYIPGN